MSRDEGIRRYCCGRRRRRSSLWRGRDGTVKLEPLFLGIQVKVKHFVCEFRDLEIPLYSPGVDAGLLTIEAMLHGHNWIAAVGSIIDCSMKLVSCRSVVIRLSYIRATPFSKLMDCCNSGASWMAAILGASAREGECSDSLFFRIFFSQLSRFLPYDC